MRENGNPLNVLVIESNGARRSVMLSMLRTMGFYNVTSASNDINCLQLISTEKVGLIICSWDLAQFNTLNLLKKIRSEEKTSKIPFIIVSTIIEQDKIKEAVLSGVSEYLVPPYNLLIFETRVNRAITKPISKVALLNKKNAVVSKKVQRQQLNQSESKLTVLIVDDVVDNIEIIKEVISDSYHVKAATNAKSALKVCLGAEPPDIILLDIMMPDVDGLTLCKQLKSTASTQDITIIFLTALSEDKDVVTGLSLGAVDYITKPIIPAILLARMEVHRTLILNQRSVQVQIDDLVNQNKLDDSFSLIFQHQIQEFIEKSNTATQNLVDHFESAKAVSEQVKQPLSDLKVNLVKGKLFLDDISLLEQLKNNKYILNEDTIHLKETFSTVIDRFSEVQHDKALEVNIDMEQSLKFHGDQKLINSLVSVLYSESVENCSKQGNITLKGNDIGEFMVIEINFDNEMSLEIIDYIEHFDLDTTVKANYNLWIYLTLYIIKTIEAEFYYHSSKSYGTSFYVKLPLVN